MTTEEQSFKNIYEAVKEAKGVLSYREIATAFTAAFNDQQTRRTVVEEVDDVWWDDQEIEAAHRNFVSEDSKVPF